MPVSALNRVGEDSETNWTLQLAGNVLVHCALQRVCAETGPHSEVPSFGLLTNTKPTGQGKICVLSLFSKFDSWTHFNAVTLRRVLHGQTHVVKINGDQLGQNENCEGCGGIDKSQSRRLNTTNQLQIKQQQQQKKGETFPQTWYKAMTETCHKQFRMCRAARMCVGKAAAGKSPMMIPKPPVAMQRQPVATKSPDKKQIKNEKRKRKKKENLARQHRASAERH
jgi:hypothetical protein